MNKLAILIPIGLGLLAGVMNFLAVRSSIKPIELVSVNDTIRPGTPIAASMLVPISVRADQAILRSAIPWEQRGIVFERRVNRELGKGEILLFADVRQMDTDAVRNLREGETSLTISVPESKIVPGLRISDDVMVVVAARGAEEEDTTITKGQSVRLVGPFRVVGLGDAPGSGVSRDEPRSIVLAVRVNNNGELIDQSARDLENARPKRPGDRPLIIGLEFPHKKVRGSTTTTETPKDK